MSKAVLLLLLLAFSSCSLKYDENPSGTDSSPELEFKDADYKKYEDKEEVFQRIEALTSSQLLEIANELFSEEQLSTLIYR